GWLAPRRPDRGVPATFPGGVAVVPAGTPGDPPRPDPAAQSPRRTLQPGPDPGGGGSRSPGGGEGGEKVPLHPQLYRTGPHRRLRRHARLAAGGTPRLHRPAQVPAGGLRARRALRGVSPLRRAQAELPAPAAAVEPAGRRWPCHHPVQAKRPAAANPAKAPDIAPARPLAGPARPRRPRRRRPWRRPRPGGQDPRPSARAPVNGPRNRLWLALRIRDLPLSALEAAASGDEPLAVAENRTLVYSNRAAEAAGITRGMDTATAQLLGGCRILPRDRHREQQALEALRDQLYRFSPHIDIHHSRATAQSGLRLELSSCLRLFSGLQPLWQAVMAELAGRGHDTRWGLAHTPMGAWLLSFARHGISGDETPGCFIERLNRLPVQVLQDHPQAVAALLDMGFATLGDIARQIQSSALASFRKRLGGEFAAFIADLYDIDRDFAQGSLFTRPLATHVPEEIFHERVEFEHPASLVAHLQPAIETLLQRLADFLRTRQLACQRIRW